MKNKKQLFLQFPEYYLLILTILGGYTPPFSFNPIFIGILGMLILLMIFKNKIVGIVLGSLFLLINLYMLGALISELSEFTVFNTAAKNLVFVGFTLWSLNMLAAVTMIYKYAFMDLKRNLLVTSTEKVF
ncbi:hypothetical protein [uncultured Dokdonia sp.]|uniref:hypothetical protein n=1 Tax=uncultured Dokdonia sp. TaxID=575653 RepID=UPI0026117378|nr:hypothetical protein [uncultured Dokdonia sp.]